MKIYTKGGDGGDTTLLGGERTAKDNERVAVYGTVDELNAAVGLALALDGGAARGAEAGGAAEGETAVGAAAGNRTLGGSADALGAVQEDLFTVGARLAASDPERSIRVGSIPVLDEERVEALEAWIDELTASLPPLEAFVLPGGSPVAAQLHVARTVCRRAERGVVAMQREQPDLGDVIIPYLNRLSDLLFTLARHANAEAGHDDVLWIPQRQRRDGS